MAHLLRVVDLPDEGLPTRPMRGSRGIVEAMKGIDKIMGKEKGRCEARCGATVRHGVEGMNFGSCYR
jgi:hypothetical protein